MFQLAETQGNLGQEGGHGHGGQPGQDGGVPGVPLHQGHQHLHEDRRGAGPANQSARADSGGVSEQY